MAVDSPATAHDSSSLSVFEELEAPVRKRLKETQNTVRVEDVRNVEDLCAGLDSALAVTEAGEAVVWRSEEVRKISHFVIRDYGSRSA